MYIGEKWISTDVYSNLSNAEFCNSKEYVRLRDICTERVTSWVEHNSKLVDTLHDAHSSSFGARQIVYADCGISTYINKIQTLGRYTYKNELRKQVAEALATEYANLPEFARTAYSLDDYVANYVDEIMKKNKNKINRGASAWVYSEMRRILDHVFW